MGEAGTGGDNHAANVQSALYRIAELASAAQDMQEFYAAVHGVVGELMHADSFFIALYDEQRQLIAWPYFVDEIPGERPDPNHWYEFGSGYGRGTTAYVLHTGRPQLLSSERIRELASQGEIEDHGATSEEISWLGVPLKDEGRTVGILAVQAYTKDVQYTDEDRDLLAFVGQHVGAALSRARAIEETRQRNAELALINSVQEAIAGELDPQAIYDVVGDKIREIFDAQVVSIRTLDEATGFLSFPYLLERGERLWPEPALLGGGFTKHVLETRRTLLIVENMDAESERYGSPTVAGSEDTKSGLFVPLVTGGTATGVIALENIDREHAFGESDQRLLETLAGSLSVALENARLVHETRQRNAELALINSVQEAIAGELDSQAIYDAVGDKIQDIFDEQGVQITVLDEATGLLHYPYHVQRGERLQAREPHPPIGFAKYVLEAREALRIGENVEGEMKRYGSELNVGAELPKSVLFVPLMSGGQATGTIALQNIDREHAFGESDQQLLETLAGSLSVALENARLVDETRQRNAELALINSVQDAIAGELDPQAIYDAVGDEIKEIFDAQVVSIRTLDETTGLLHIPYLSERGERLEAEPKAPAGFGKHVLEARESLLITEDVAAEMERYESSITVGGAPKSVLLVPLVTGENATGIISLQNLDREHAFGESDRQLLETLAGGLSVALENARLVHETRQRNAELALINSVQSALAGELELQAIYDVVGDKIQEIFDAQGTSITTVDEVAGVVRFPYLVERGERLTAEPRAMGATGFTAHVLKTREPLLINENLSTEVERFAAVIVAGEEPKSLLFVPLVMGGRANGVIALENFDREHAFTDADVRLLTTLAGSLGVALENARLVYETRQRNAELALINSVQEALAGELEMQPIYDVVGDKIQEIFDAQVVDIGIYDFAAGMIRFPYAIERGVRYPDQPAPIEGSPLTRALLEAKAPLVLNDIDAWFDEHGETQSAIQGEPARSALLAPLTSGDEVRGRISLQNLDRTNAFSENDLRLLTTLAGSLSVALENARLVHETRQRNAELALINSVQDAIAGELDSQAIYDAVGDRIQEIFDAQVVAIATIDEAASLLHYPYIIERGARLQADPGSPLGFAKHVLETRQTVLINENVAAEAERYGSLVMEGEEVRSVLFVPLVTAGKAMGVISLQNLDREHAFSESDQQLLETLAGSLSVALENARLVHETRQRNAELALINSVQDAIAGELDPQAIYDAVGDKIREVFDAQVVAISTLDTTTGLVSHPYIIERGERQQAEPSEISGFTKHVVDTRESLLIAEHVIEEAERYGSTILTGEPTKSVLFVPLVTGGRVNGTISLQNVDREHAFGESDQQLLETLAGSLSVALENARLVHETRQRNAELGLINSVQDAIAGELDPQAIFDAVGDRIRDVFDAHTMTIGTLDETTELMNYPYIIERGERLQAEPVTLRGFAKHVLETREPLLIVEDVAGAAERYGSQILAGAWPMSILFVPLVVGGKATGVISLQNIDREHAFSESDQQLLTTLAGSLGVALDNARLVHETRQRVSELATVNSVGRAISSLLELDALIELVGEHVRETFEADLAFVALHDRSAGRIDFAYYHERGERRNEPSIPFGEGLTSRIIDSREPLLLNRSEQFADVAERVGTMVRSFLGVPILVGERAIGTISVQSIEAEGRFDEADSRLLATIAANVGVAIQNARLFTEVERQRGYLESLVSITPAAVVVLDADERVTDWNPAAAELFGYSAEEALGRPIDELVFGEAGDEEGRKIMEEAISEGRAQRITRRLRRDGTPVDVELMLVPLTVDGARAGFLGVYHDVTELERARQEAEAATQAKSAFLATMSHEIRTPMNAVIGMTDLLLATDLTGEQREFAEIVHSSGDALLHVIDDILDYSKIEAGKLDLERQPFRLRDCVEGALDIVAPRAWEKGIELGCLIDEAAPAGVLGDEARLRQVLLNLLSNGVKFTEEAGEVVILVDAEETGPGSYRLDLSVRDTGIGIPTDRMDRLFTSFSQVDASTTRRFGGTGLGLAISKRLVELMGGTISVESEQGSGSTFRISVPVTSAEVPSPIPLEEGLPQLAGKRILIVDDNATNREIVTRHARSWGMEPVDIEFPVEALELIEAGEPFDVAVLDMMMPGMDGLALAGEIRARRSEEELPLLLLTSLGRIPQAERGSVFSAQLAKPLKASQLYNTLLQLLAGGMDEAETSEAATDGKQAVSSLRILLAEDNPMNQKVALRLLERLGYSADVAWNGLEALAALEERPYDVVLMDVQMPELDGLDATRRICERWPGETRPHIIAMTANALPEDREACFAAGMNDYVAKPIRAAELGAALKRVEPLAATTDAISEEGDVNLDADALRNLRDLGGDEFLTEVVDAFLADAPDLMVTLRRSLDEQKADELRRAAHTLKSNGATLGAESFAELCRTLEQQAKDGRLDDASELVSRIEQEYRPLEESLAALRSEPAL